MRHHSHIEENTESGEYLKATIFGGLDGVLTSFAIVSGSIGTSTEITSSALILVQGGDFSWKVTAILGVSSIIADGIAMAVGDYLSSKAYDQYVNSEKQREHWEYHHYKEGEIREVVEIFVKRGMEQTDAEYIVPILARYEDIFVNFMVSEELGLQVPKGSHMDLAVNSLVMFLSFVFFGFFPLIPYLLGSLNLITPKEMIQISIGCTAFALFLLGAIKSTFR
jgi:VIT1/CCC1 family predicted Fe2+/Mn2+ transporter